MRKFIINYQSRFSINTAQSFIAAKYRTTVMASRTEPCENDCEKGKKTGAEGDIEKIQDDPKTPPGDNNFCNKIIFAKDGESNKYETTLSYSDTKEKKIFTNDVSYANGENNSDHTFTINVG